MQSCNRRFSFFFLNCPAYIVPRGKMVDQLLLLLPKFTLDMQLNRNQNNIVNVLVNGTKNELLDIELFNVVASYIEESHRFDYN